MRMRMRIDYNVNDKDNENGNEDENKNIGLRAVECNKLIITIYRTSELQLRINNVYYPLR